MSEGEPSPNADKASAGKKSAFRARLLSTVILWGLVVAAVVFSKPLLYLVLIELVVLTSVWEFFKIVDLPGAKARGIVMVLISGVYLAGLFFLAPVLGESALLLLSIVDVFALVLVFFYAVLAEFRSEPEPGSGLARVTVTLFGFLWIPFLFGFVAKLLFMPGEEGVYIVLFLVAVTKFTDMGAYVTGSLIGKTPFMKHISPKKTCEGIAGGMLFALGAALAMAGLFGEKMPGFGWFNVLILAIVLGVAAVVGDLVESVVKRTWQTKDSGQVLPGIGGTLDLIDSICFGAPVMFFYLLLLG